MEAGDPEEHAKKLTAHKESGKCKCNFEGSSGAMEVEGALKMWNRSIQKHNLIRKMYFCRFLQNSSYNIRDVTVGVQTHKYDPYWCTGARDGLWRKELVNVHTPAKFQRNLSRIEEVIDV